MNMNENDDILSEQDEKTEKPDDKEKKRIRLFIIIVLVYLAVCAAVYVGLDLRQRNSYVKVTPIETRASPDEWTEAEKININTASVEELCKVNGIGEVTAGKIIKYREKNGGFNSLDELLNIGGIGEKTLKKIKPYLKV